MLKLEFTALTVSLFVPSCAKIQNWLQIMYFMVKYVCALCDQVFCWPSCENFHWKW